MSVDPIGTDWWWHLSAPEQQMYRQNLMAAASLQRKLNNIRRESAQIRTIAKSRCARMPEHAHSMRGLVENSLPSDES